MKRKVLVCLMIAVCLITVRTDAPKAASNDDIPRMSVEDLKKLLDDPESGLIIIDVRTGSSWTHSDVMIKTAIRENPTNFESWAQKHPKEKTLVLYCT